MMEEGVNMIKELIKIKENNNIVSIFCDEDDTSMFLEGYIYAIGRQDFLIKHITPHGLADGYILKKIDSVMHLEISGQYEKKIEKLYSKKNQRHIAHLLLRRFFRRSQYLKIQLCLRSGFFFFSRRTAEALLFLYLL